MNIIKKMLSIVAMIGLAIASTVSAGTNVTANITDDEVWTKENSPYHLKKQIYVEPGVSLTMEAGTVVASFTPDQGSLCVTRGAKIYVMGTQDEPVIMTSAQDVNKWSGSVCVSQYGVDPCRPTESVVTSITTMGNPKTGVWLERCNDWGNLTILGRGLISASHYGGSAVTYQDGESNSIYTNTKCPDGLNKKVMEGLTAKFAGDSNVVYGGDNDDDDSGEIHYLSIRYGGKVIGFANELNGLSLGALGRATDIDHVEIMNNVDDGIEIWGGTLNLKYVSVWNIGDDSFDVDEGWRGKLQFGLMVQGYSVDAAQGSGVGDNIFETDGAEQSDAQPVTTAVVYNVTCVGQPAQGDHGTAWRDNARLQYRNCIFMDLGEKLVSKDNTDGDGGAGYGYNNALSWEATWETNAGTDPNAQNLCGATLSSLYATQTDGKLAEISDSVFCRNNFASAYTEADANCHVFDASNNNVTSDANHLPIQMLVRGPGVTRGGKLMLPVIGINPCPANDAVTSVKTAPADGFFTPAQYRGGFGPCGNWLAGWTATSAYGMTDKYAGGPQGDLNYDSTVNFLDFSILANNWLQGI